MSLSISGTRKKARQPVQKSPLSLRKGSSKARKRSYRQKTFGLIKGWPPTCETMKEGVFLRQLEKEAPSKGEKKKFASRKKKKSRRLGWKASLEIWRKKFRGSSGKESNPSTKKKQWSYAPRKNPASFENTKNF